MLAIERRNEILEKLRTEQRVLVSELSEHYGVTEETIRRDLDKLEKEGYATKTYGGAIFGNSTKIDLSYTIRNRTNVEAKRSIADIINKIIEDGDHIMFDDSSTSLYIAKKIKTKKKNLTVITNSIEIVMELADVEDWNIMSTGGTLKAESLALVGHQAQQMIQNYHVDKAFISCKGIDPSSGITDSNENHSLIKKTMISAAKETVLALDSSKFNKTSFVQIADFDAIDYVVTDEKPDKNWLDLFESKGIICYYPGAKN